MNLNHVARPLATVVAPALLVLSLSACGGGGSSAPEDASKDDFCNAYNNDDAGDVDEDGTPEEQAEAFKDQLDSAVEDLKDVGTPEDIPDDAREGYEVFVDTISDLDEDDIQKAIEDEDLDSLEQGVDKDDQEKVKAFTEWAGTYCG